MSEIRTPVQIVDDVMDSEEFVNLSIEDLGHARYDIAIAVIKADRAQHPERKLWDIVGDNGERMSVTCTKVVAEDITDALNSMSGSVTAWEAVEAGGVQ